MKLAMNKKILSRALLNAFLVGVLICVFVHLSLSPIGWSSPNDPNMFIFLCLSIVSICVVALFVLLKPILLYVKGEKKEAIHLFLYTLGFILVITGLIYSIVATQVYQVVTRPATGMRCGGNMMNAPICEAGYHCAPARYGNAPIGDVGGICVPD